jgi:hypothetical protein
LPPLRKAAERYEQVFTNPIKKMKALIEKINNKMLPVIFLLGTFFAIVQHIETQTWGINKTVGWAWDLTPIGWLVFILSSIAFFFFYLILILLKSKPNKTLSIIQVILIIIVGSLHKELGDGIIFLLNLLVGIIFLINIIVTITRKRKIDSIKPAHNSSL